jgi:hypothetical protein
MEAAGFLAVVIKIDGISHFRPKVGFLNKFQKWGMSSLP